MKKKDIKVGRTYLVGTDNGLIIAKVDRIREPDKYTSIYDLTCIKTKGKTAVKGANCFIEEVIPEGEQRSDPTGVVVNDHVGCAEVATENKVNVSLMSSDEAIEEVVKQHDLEEGTVLAFDREARGEDENSRPFVEPVNMVTQNPSPVHSAIASRIAASGNGSNQSIGSPVAGMTPNEEQEGILEVAVQQGLKALVISAGAGTGKTATLKMLEQTLKGRGQYTAFNKSLVEESRSKFKKASVATTHALAFKAIGKDYVHRLNADRMRSGMVARILGIDPLVLEMAGEVDNKGLPRTKTLSAEFLAGQVLVAVKRYCTSADRTINKTHIKWIDGIDVVVSDKCGKENQEKVREYLLPFVNKAWQDLSSINGKLPFNHDIYVKLWQLGTGEDRPVIAADYILLDEAQDTAPVFLDIIKQQTHALLIMVGDENQQIYEWRGAVNAMGAFENAPRKQLSQSYRFGQAIADVANTILSTLIEPTDLIMRGNPSLPSRVVSSAKSYDYRNHNCLDCKHEWKSKVELSINTLRLSGEKIEQCSKCNSKTIYSSPIFKEIEEPKCYLYRTNAGAVGRVMRSIEEGKKPHLIGGGSEVVRWCEAAIDLQSIPVKKTNHPDLCCFDNWKEVVEYSLTDEGQEIRLMVKLIKEFGAEEIRDALKDMPDEDKADLVVSTAHKSKGREWDTVKLGPDFPTANKMSDSDRRLLYVAATRAKLTLDISECPPFCGGNDSRDTGNPESSGAWIPGLEIVYTKPMPTKEEQEEWINNKNKPKEEVKITVNKDVGRIIPIPQPTSTTTFTGTFTWTKYDNKWLVRGPIPPFEEEKDVIGTKVEVSRRDGSKQDVIIKSVVKKYGDAWIYGI